MYIVRMVEVITTDEFAVWYDELNTADTEAVTRVVGLREARGVTLGFPYSSDIKGIGVNLTTGANLLIPSLQSILAGF